MFSIVAAVVTQTHNI